MKIKDWNKFQHFKDRKPPWIKLYRDLLDDPEWHELDPASAKVLVMIWLIASEEMGELPNLKKLAFRLRMSEKQVEMHCSKLSHWLIQDDINLISERYQSDAPETETETETETEKKRERASPNGSRLPADWTLPEEWKSFCQAERPDLLPSDVAARFSDYWHGVAGAKGRKADWLATWRNWVRGEKKALAGPSVTVPSRPGIDPTLARLKQEEALVKPMPPEIRAKLFG